MISPSRDKSRKVFDERLQKSKVILVSHNMKLIQQHVRRGRSPRPRTATDVYDDVREGIAAYQKGRGRALTPSLEWLSARNLRLGIIVVPWLLAAIYLGVFAADRYVSESVLRRAPGGSCDGHPRRRGRALRDVWQLDGVARGPVHAGGAYPVDGHAAAGRREARPAAGLQQSASSTSSSGWTRTPHRKDFSTTTAAAWRSKSTTDRGS